MLDHVPNHTGLDHPWIETHPNYFVGGTERDMQRQPQNFTRVETRTGPRIFAYGRDPNFDGWPDTLQLDYGNPDLQDARIAELLDIAGQCDGVRCDMAMLILPEVFRRTWGIEIAPFWPRAIARVREQYPGFLFMAEVYWDLEWTLQQQGFDYSTTSGSTIACATGPLVRSATTWSRRSTIKTSSLASSRTMTNRAPRRRSIYRSTGQRRPSRFSRRGSGSSNRVSSTAGAPLH